MNVELHSPHAFMACKGTTLLYCTSFISLTIGYKLEYNYIQLCRCLEFLNDIESLVNYMEESGGDLFKGAVLKLGFGG
jgi:hypothetical protein